MNRKEAMKIKPLSILEVKFDNQENEMCILTQKFTRYDRWLRVTFIDGEAGGISPKQIVRAIGKLNIDLIIRMHNIITG